MYYAKSRHYTFTKFNQDLDLNELPIILHKIKGRLPSTLIPGIIQEQNTTLELAQIYLDEYSKFLAMIFFSAAPGFGR